MKRRHRSYAYTEPVQRREVRHDYYDEERVVGYDVTYPCGGNSYSTRMRHDPGDRLRMRVRLEPVE